MFDDHRPFTRSAFRERNAVRLKSARSRNEMVELLREHLEGAIAAMDNAFDNPDPDDDADEREVWDAVREVVLDCFDKLAKRR